MSETSFALARWIAVTAVVVVQANEASAYNSSAWTRPTGEVWSLVSFGYVAAETQFLVDGQEAPFIEGIQGRPTFEDASFYAQIETGLLEGLSLNVSVPFKRVFIERESFFTETEAIGDLYLGIRGDLGRLVMPDLPLAWSLEAGVSLPTGYTRNLAPSVGPGNVNVELKTTVGYGFALASWLPAYAQTGVGLRIRTGAFGLSTAVDCGGNDVDCVIDSQPDYSEEIIYLGELGLTPFGGGLLVFTKVFGNHSIPEPDEAFTARNPIPERQRFVKVGGGGAVYPLRLVSIETLENLGIAFQAYATVAGRNTVKSTDLFFGLELKENF